MSWTKQPRFYAPDLTADDEYRLSGGEARHLVQVLRLKAGASVCLFDGRGQIAHAQVQAAAKNFVDLQVLERQTRESDRTQFVLATATPKGERFRWLIEKATELNVSRLVPLRTEHGVVDPGAGKLDKMQQAVIAACKQCRRDRLMEIAAPMPWEAFLQSHRPEQGPLLVAHPQGVELTGERIAEYRGAAVMTAIVGPEGGLTDTELALAQRHGATLVGLGQHILRIETAGIALAALFGT